MKLLSFLILTLWLLSVESKEYFILKLQKLNWFAAFQDCISRGMQLATINSQDEQSNLEAAIKKAGVSASWLWTAGTDQGEEGNFVWMTTAEPIIYSKWGNGQPDNAGGNENCLHIWNRGGELNWNDLGCANKLYYVCEQKVNQNGITIDINL